MSYTNHTISSLMKLKNSPKHTYQIQIYISYNNAHDYILNEYILKEHIEVYSFTDIIKFLTYYNILNYHSVPNIYNQINNKMRATLYTKTNTYEPVRIVINKYNHITNANNE